MTTGRTIKFQHPDTKQDMTLYFTPKTVTELERRGFSLDKVQTKPMTMLPLLWYGAFLAKYSRKVTQTDTDKWLSRMKHKSELYEILIELYQAPMAALLFDDDDDEDDSGNGLDWSVE